MEKTGFFSRLKVKISLYVLAGGILFSGAVLYFTYSHLTGVMQTALWEQGTLMASGIEELAAERLIEEDAVGLKKIVEKYRHHKSNEYILIADANYNILVDTYDGQVPLELTSPDVYTNFNFSSGERYEISPITVAGKEIFDIVAPIKEGFLGFVRIGIKKSVAEEQVMAALLPIGAVIGVATLLAMLLAFWVITTQITRPVRQLTRAAREISLGNFQTSVEVTASNEFNELARAIDRMKESLQSSLERLKTRTSTLGRF